MSQDNEGLQKTAFFIKINTEVLSHET